MVWLRIETLPYEVVWRLEIGDWGFRGLAIWKYGGLAIGGLAIGGLTIGSLEV